MPFKPSRDFRGPCKFPISSDIHVRRCFADRQVAAPNAQEADSSSALGVYKLCVFIHFRVSSKPRDIQAEVNKICDVIAKTIQVPVVVSIPSSRFDIASLWGITKCSQASNAKDRARQSRVE